MLANRVLRDWQIVSTTVWVQSKDADLAWIFFVWLNSLMGLVFFCAFDQPCRVDLHDAAIATGGRLFSDILNYVSSGPGARK